MQCGPENRKATRPHLNQRAEKRKSQPCPYPRRETIHALSFRPSGEGERTRRGSPPDPKPYSIVNIPPRTDIPMDTEHQRRRDGEMFARFPGLFPRNQPVSIDHLAVGPGWTPILEDLVHDLSKLQAIAPRPFHILQIKEKLGSLRVHRSHPTDAANAAIDRASRLSAGVCEFYGAPSTIRIRGGWFTTQCDACALNNKRK